MDGRDNFYLTLTCHQHVAVWPSKTYLIAFGDTDICRNDWFGANSLTLLVLPLATRVVQDIRLLVTS